WRATADRITGTALWRATATAPADAMLAARRTPSTTGSCASGFAPESEPPMPRCRTGPPAATPTTAAAATRAARPTARQWSAPTPGGRRPIAGRPP
ncbi:MAG: hypothetical protein AVDCRST_MAG76-2107, partial [uncultured Acidimicrobiales bacterium]